jgi:aryl-alcohol dehydrogenase-like predicted oxidoreductase
MPTNRDHEADSPNPLTRVIPRSGEALAAIGLGTFRSFDVDPRRLGSTRLAEVLERFCAAGAGVIDTSPMYGHAEAALGALLAARPAGAPRPFLATKVWTTGRAAGLRQIEDSFRLLGTEVIDLIQVHNLVDLDTQLATLRALKAEGRIRYLGITHYQASAFTELERLIEREALDFVQFNYSAVDRAAERRLLPACAATGTATLINRPLDQGALLARLAAHPLPDWAAGLGCRDWAAAALKFVLSHPAVSCAIPATAQPEHLAANLRAALGPLPDADLRERIAADLARLARR